MVTMGEVMASCRFESYCEHKICNNTKVSDTNYTIMYRDLTKEDFNK